MGRLSLILPRFQNFPANADQRRSRNQGKKVNLTISNFKGKGMATLIASREGATKLQQAREQSGRTVDSLIWLEEASQRLNPAWKSSDYYATGVNEASWRRFLYRLKPINEEIFKAYCSVLGVNWEDVAEVPSEQGTVSLISFAFDSFWVGRINLVKNLKNLLQSSCRVLALTGITGIGKTALAENLVMDLQPFPNLCRINLDHYEKPSEFASIAAYLLESWKQPVSEDDRRDSQRLLNWLVTYLQQNSCLLLIDSLENVLQGNEDTGWSEFSDPLWVQFFQKLLSAEVCESKVVLTSQDFPAQLVEIGGKFPQLYHCSVVGGLTVEEQLMLFQQMGLQVENPEFRGHLEHIGRAYEGHPLALRVIAGEILQTPFNGNVQIYWKQYGHEIDQVEQLRQQTELKGYDDSLKLAKYSRNLRQRVKQRIEKTLQRLSREVPLAYVLLCLGAVYRRPVPEQFWLRSLQGRSLDENQQLAVLDALFDRYLAESVVIDRDLLIRQHNLIRSTALEHLKKLQP